MYYNRNNDGDYKIIKKIYYSDNHEMQCVNTRQIYGH